MLYGKFKEMKKQIFLKKLNASMIRKDSIFEKRRRREKNFLNFSHFVFLFLIEIMNNKKFKYKKKTQKNELKKIHNFLIYN